MTIEIKQLRYAVTTADTKSFSRAAGVLNIKQSTLSKRISLMEQRLGVTLFERTTRGAVPTDTGKAFIEVARRIVTDVDNLKTTARAVHYGEVGRLVVGFSSSLSAGNLRMALGDYLENFPEVQLDAVENGCEQLLAGLQSRIIDVAIHGRSFSDPAINKRSLWSERLMVALPKEHFLINAETIFWTDLRKEVFVLPTLCSGAVISDLLANRLSGIGYTPNVISQETGHENILNMISFGKFITIIGESAMGATRPDLVFREISETTGQARLDIAAYWRKDNDNPALQRFFKLIDERYPYAERA